jgi:hypothetical protein
MRKRSNTSTAARSRSRRGGASRIGARHTTLRARTPGSRNRRRTTSRARGKSTSAHITTDHQTIQRWAETRGGWPATVTRTARGEAAGILRIDFPGFSGGGSLKPISWEDWFDKFEESDLAFLYQDKTAGGKQSRFFKLIERE